MIKFIIGTHIFTFTARICSEHFTSDCYKIKPDYFKNCENYSPTRVRKLIDSAVPTVNLHQQENRQALKEVTDQQNIIDVNKQIWYVLLVINIINIRS